jgi:tetratricopeptide (TPR) repeat protein
MIVIFFIILTIFHFSDYSTEFEIINLDRMYKQRSNSSALKLAKILYNERENFTKGNILLIAEVFKNNKEYENALELYHKFDNEDIEINLLKADCYVKLKDYDKVNEIYSKFENDFAQELKKAVKINIVRDLREQEKYEEAMELILENEDKVEPELKNLFLAEKGWVLFYLGEHAKALEIFKENLQNSTRKCDKINSLYNLGEYYFKIGDYEKATNYYNEISKYLKD